MIITIPSFGMAKTGGDRVLTTLANNLVERGHSVTIANLGNSQIPYILSDKVHVVSIPFDVDKKDLVNYGLTGINRLANNLPQSDIYLANFVYTVLPCIANYTKGQTVFLAQANEARDFKEETLKIFSGISYEAYKLNIPIVTPSSYLQNWIKQQFHNDSIIIPPFVDTAVFKPSIIASNTGKLKLLFVGNTRSANKGFDILIEACQQLEEIPFTLYVATQENVSIGNTGFEIEMIQPANDSELSTLYRKCDVFVSLSKEEGFGLALLEAMASGLVCVTTASGGIADFASNNKNCLVVERNAQAVANRIKDIYKNIKYYQKHLTHNAIKTAEKYSERKMVDSFEKLFLKIYKGSRPNP